MKDNEDAGSDRGLTVAERIAEIRREMDLLVDMVVIRALLHDRSAALDVRKQGAELLSLEEELETHIGMAEYVREEIGRAPALETECMLLSEVPGSRWSPDTIRSSLMSCMDTEVQYRRQRTLNTLRSGEREREEALLGLEPEHQRAIERWLTTSERHNEVPDEPEVGLRMASEGGYRQVRKDYEEAACKRFERLLAEYVPLAAGVYAPVRASWTYEVHASYGGLCDTRWAWEAIGEVLQGRDERDAVERLRRAGALLEDAGRPEAARQAEAAARELETFLSVRDARTPEAKLTEAEMEIALVRDGVQLTHGRALYERLVGLHDDLVAEARPRRLAAHEQARLAEDERDDGLIPYFPDVDDHADGEAREPGDDSEGPESSAGPDDGREGE